MIATVEVIGATLMLLASHFAFAADPAERSARLVKEAKQLVTDIDQGHYDKVEARFDKNMADALPIDKFTATSKAISQQTGALKSIGETTTSEKDGFFIVLMQCEFTNAPFDAQVVFDGEEKIAGLLYKPHPIPTTYVAPDYVNPAAFVEREMTIGSGTLSVPGTLTLPKDKAAVPAIVLVQGSGPQDRDETIGPNRVFRDIAWGLASKGVAVFRFEKRTHAHPEAFKGSYTIDDETTNDAVAAAQALRDVKEIDSSRIYIGGHSQGAMMAPRIAQRDPNLRGLVLLAAPARPLEDIIVDQQTYLLADASGTVDHSAEVALDGVKQKRDEIKHLDAANPPKEPLLMDVPASYWLDLRAYDPVAVAATLKMPILVLQGLRDFQVTAPDFARWKDLCAKKADVRCESYPSLNHLFIAGSGRSVPTEYGTVGHVDANVVSDIAAWINHVKAAG